MTPTFSSQQEDSEPFTRKQTRPQFPALPKPGRKRGHRFFPNISIDIPKKMLEDSSKVIHPINLFGIETNERNELTEINDDEIIALEEVRLDVQEEQYLFPDAIDHEYSWRKKSGNNKY
jgi:hypothetical protein